MCLAPIKIAMFACVSSSTQILLLFLLVGRYAITSPLNLETVKIGDMWPTHIDLSLGIGSELQLRNCIFSLMTCLLLQIYDGMEKTVIIYDLLAVLDITGS